MRKSREPPSGEGRRREPGGRLAEERQAERDGSTGPLAGFALGAGVDAIGAGAGVGGTGGAPPGADLGGANASGPLRHTPARRRRRA